MGNPHPKSGTDAGSASARIGRSAGAEPDGAPSKSSWARDRTKAIGDTEHREDRMVSVLDVFDRGRPKLPGSMEFAAFNPDWPCAASK